MESGKYKIGWTEYVDFPEWGIGGIKAKIDTGARTSTLHAENIEVDETETAHFDVILSRKPPWRKVRVSAPVIKKGNVRSSTGEYAERCFVKAVIRIGKINQEIELNLVSRRDMLFRMLIGRKALEEAFLVDAGRRYVLSRKPKSRKKSSL